MSRFRPSSFAAIGLALFVTHAAQAGIITTVSAPGVQTSSALDTTAIDFEGIGNGYHGSDSFTLSGGLTAGYAGNHFIVGHDQYGGAGGTGNYLSLQSTNVVTVTLNQSQAYFGFWLSAADVNNQLEFYNGTTLVGSFSGSDPLITSLAPGYYGNPNAEGQDPSEAFVFVNFYSEAAGDMFNKIVMTQVAGGTGFESDNHTFSATLQAPSPVPEPSALASSAIAIMLVSGAWMYKKKQSAAGPLQMCGIGAGC
jgi:hypothetical protein